jgi:hypothetical protein
MDVLMADVGIPGGSAFGLVAGVVVFLVLFAAALLLFRMLGRSVRFIFRLVLAGLLLIAAFAGLIALWWYV